MESDILNLSITIGVICMDFYKNAIGSALVLFVPAQCGNHPCNPIENLIRGDKIYISGATLNFLALLCFCILGFIEFKRENWLNHYLIVNPNLTLDPEAFSTKFDKLTTKRKDKLIFIDKIYKRWAFFTVFIYCLNVIISAYIIFSSYLDDKTPVALITNIMLLGHKFYDVYMIIGNGKIFVSAYKSRHVQFNDVNPQKIKVIADENGL
jgi:hypothetical protein